jgi:hypothetical protein
MDWDKWIEKLQADPDNFDIDRETRIALTSSPEWLEENDYPENPLETLEDDFRLGELLELLRSAPFELDSIFKFDVTGEYDRAVLSLDRFRIGDTSYLVEYFEAPDDFEHCGLSGTYTAETEHAVLNGLAQTFGADQSDWGRPEISNFKESIVPESMWIQRMASRYGEDRIDRMTYLPFRLDRRVGDITEVNWAAVAMAAWHGDDAYRGYESAVEAWPRIYAGSIFSRRTPIEVLQELAEEGNDAAKNVLEQLTVAERAELHEHAVTQKAKEEG